MIIPSEQASDTLVVTLSRPSAVFHALYYSLLLLFLMAVVWASMSSVEISVHAQGTIRPSQGVHAYSSLFTTMIDSVYVSENQRIHRGDTLVSFIMDGVALQLALARADIMNTKVEIEDLKHLIRMPVDHPRLSLPHYRSEYDAVQKELGLNAVEIGSSALKYHRADELKKKSLISDAEYEEAKRMLDLAQTKLDGYRHTTVSHYEHELFTKERTLEELETKERVLRDEEKKRFMIANADGVLYHLAVKKGGVPVVAGQELLSLTPSTDLQMEFWVPAKDIGFVKEGLTARYEIDAYPYREWGAAEGRICSVSNDVIVDPQTGAQLFKIVGSLSSSRLISRRSGYAAELIKGLTCRAHVVVAQKRLIDMLYDKTIPYVVFH